MKRTPVPTTEGWTRFNNAMRHILGVSKEELNRREEEYQKESKANPHRRGPKPKPSGPGPVSGSRA